MKFIDEAVITVKAGHGGPGVVSFRREKFVPYGGPDGGNGGHGGSVIAYGDRNRHTLLDLKFKTLWEAEAGKPGDGNRREGKWAEDLRIGLPLGTQIFRVESGELFCDLVEDGQEIVLAAGGRGGRGNDFFKTATNRAPDYAQPGEAGGEDTYQLSLKLVADVGIIGLPNAGKSTLISRISAARPKIADYPFTTLTPNLGVVQAKGRTFVVADVPGLIPGAHTGKGLGIKFLKHIERTSVLAHLIDATQVDDEGTPIDLEVPYNQICEELSAFSPELAARSQIAVITKIDAISDREWLDAEVEKFRTKGIKTMLISSASGIGIDDLIVELATMVTTHDVANPRVVVVDDE